MKRCLLPAILLGFAVLALSSTAVAQGSGQVAACHCYCGKVLRAPCGENDCKRACGWTGGSSGGSSGYPSVNDDAAAAAAAEAERQRQEEELRRQEEERQRQEAEEAQRRQAEFERNKQEALRDMKGIAGELGLKGVETDDNPGLKGLGDTGTGGLGLKDVPSSTGAQAAKNPDCQWGNLGSAVVDLRCLGLDPDKPISLDPHVVRGQQRVFPAQIDPATFKNPNYNKGFEALMRRTFSVKDAMDAIASFEAAQAQRANDPLVHNALLLAQDILKGRQRKEQEDQARAMQSLYHGIAALMMGDVRTAGDSVERAQKIDPASSTIGPWARLMVGLGSQYTGAEPGKKVACQLVGNALIFESRGEFRNEIYALETAARLVPDDLYVKSMLWRARHLKPENPDFSSVAPGATTTYPAGSTLAPAHPGSSSVAPRPQ